MTSKTIYNLGCPSYLYLQNALVASGRNSGLLKLLKLGVLHIQQVILLGGEAVQHKCDFGGNWRLNIEALQGGSDAQNVLLVLVVAAGLGTEHTHKLAIASFTALCQVNAEACYTFMCFTSFVCLNHFACFLIASLYPGFIEGLNYVDFVQNKSQDDNRSNIKDHVTWHISYRIIYHIMYCIVSYRILHHIILYHIKYRITCQIYYHTIYQIYYRIVSYHISYHIPNIISHHIIPYCTIYKIQYHTI